MEENKYFDRMEKSIDGLTAKIDSLLVKMNDFEVQRVRDSVLLTDISKTVNQHETTIEKLKEKLNQMEIAEEVRDEERKKDIEAHNVDFNKKLAIVTVFLGIISLYAQYVFKG